MGCKKAGCGGGKTIVVVVAAGGGRRELAGEEVETSKVNVVPGEDSNLRVGVVAVNAGSSMPTFTGLTTTAGKLVVGGDNVGAMCDIGRAEAIVVFPSPPIAELETLLVAIRLGIGSKVVGREGSAMFVTAFL